MPVFAYSFYVNSGLAKSDDIRIKMFMVSAGMLGIIVANLVITWVSNGVWYVLKLIPGYDSVMRLYPELFAPAIRTLGIICNSFFDDGFLTSYYA